MYYFDKYSACHSSQVETSESLLVLDVGATNQLIPNNRRPEVAVETITVVVVVVHVRPTE